MGEYFVTTDGQIKMICDECFKQVKRPKHQVLRKLKFKCINGCPGFLRPKTKEDPLGERVRWFPRD